jgi:hypothetical protein
VNPQDQPKKHCQRHDYNVFHGYGTNNHGLAGAGGGPGLDPLWGDRRAGRREVADIIRQYGNSFIAGRRNGSIRG